MNEHNRPKVPNKYGVWWQVYLPSIILCLVFVAAAIWVAVGAFNGRVDASAGADLVVILLCLPNLLLALLGLVIVCGLCYGVMWLAVKLPPYVRQATGWLVQLSQRTTQVAQRIAKPTTQLGSRLAQLDALLQRKRNTRQP